jgi:hypothetical protein
MGGMILSVMIDLARERLHTVAYTWQVALAGVERWNTMGLLYLHLFLLDGSQSCLHSAVTFPHHEHVFGWLSFDAVDAAYGPYCMLRHRRLRP